MKWVDNLRQIYEQQIWDPSYDVLDCDIHIHFAIYLKEILEPRLSFEDNKIMLDGKKEITSVYLFCFFQIKVLREIFDEYIYLENLLKLYESKIDELKDTNLSESRTMSDITYCRKKTEKARNINILKSKSDELTTNIMLLKEFKEHIKTKLNTHEKVENIVKTMFIVTEFEKFESTLITEYKPSTEIQEKIDTLKDIEEKEEKEDIVSVLKV
jgi:hypothetical protein